MAVSTELSRQLADSFNAGCTCVSLDRQQLTEALAAQLGGEITATLVHRFPGLFADVALFLPASEFQAMQHLIETVENVAATPAYQQRALQDAPAIARRDPGPRGVFMGYDFHRDGDAPKLIEINTNAGGAFLNAALLHAQQVCCAEMAAVLWPPVAGDFTDHVLAMFREEWARQRGQAVLRRIAIVDDDPAGQFLYPEFELARRLFAGHGIEAVIVDAACLRYTDGKLWHENEEIDLVYNRLTDFLLSDPAHAALHHAYLNDAVVLTPHPHCYALFADKRNLIPLSDAEQLRQWQLPESMRQTLLRSIPRTLALTAGNAGQLWSERKHWFFKPARGYGSKASYRGDKLTKGTWAGLQRGDYVAQAFAPPSERLVESEGTPTALKTDVRLYRYHGRTLLAAARLYQGQTTNMRTPGGGFSPVFLI